MKRTFFRTSAKILFGLLWFGVFRQDTFATLVTDTAKNAYAAPENNYNDEYEIFYHEPEHQSTFDESHVIVETIIHETMYIPIQQSFPSSHFKDIFLGSSAHKRGVEIAPMDEKTERAWYKEPNAKLNSIVDSYSPSPYLSFKDLLKSLQPPENEQEEHFPFSDPLLILAPEDHEYINDINADINDMHNSDINAVHNSIWDESDENYNYFPHLPKSSKSPNSYKDLLLELSSTNIEASGTEEASEISPSSVSSFDASADSDKLDVNPKVVASLPNDTPPSEGSDSTKPSALEYFLKSILPIFLSPASFDITFPGNEMESRPLTETTENVGFNSK